MEARLGETPFSVVDLETTGIYPGGHDRIVEIAIVRMSPDGHVDDEWASLVNPERDIGRTDIHGITSDQVLNAPRFTDLVGDVDARLSGAVVVGHNLRFDQGFLAAEFRRAGVAMPEFPSLCTLHLAHRFAPDLPSRKLAFCCEEFGILHEEEHCALEDARATAALLEVFLTQAPEHGISSLRALGCEHVVAPEPGWSGAHSGATCCSRDAATKAVRVARSYLARLVERLPGNEASSPVEAEYLNVLDRALEDRVVTSHEAEALVSQAAAWGMSRADVIAAHRRYLSGLVVAALADQVITRAERRDLELVTELLGLTMATLTDMVERPRAPLAAGPNPADLRGSSVCFTGELLGVIDGERITRERAEDLARAAGLDIRDTVTKKLDLLVVADPSTQSGKAKKARAYGTRVMAEAAFWKAIGVSVT